MVTLGTFSKMFARPTLGETLDAVRSLGIEHVQLNTVPSGDIRREFESRRMTLAILSATFNIIHPDLENRRAGVERVTQLAKSAKGLGTTILSVSTGTRDAEDMWRKHPQNDSPEAWREMLGAMEELAKIAEEQDVTIAFEPEQANVVDSAQKARELLDALQSKHVKVLMDAANLLNLANLRQQDRVLRNAFDLLGEEIVVAHAKEFSEDGTLGNAVLGSGVIDFPLYTSLLRKLGRPISIIMHGFAESEAPESAQFLKRELAKNDL